MRRLSPKDPDSVEWFNWDCTETIQSGTGGTITQILAGPIAEPGYGSLADLDIAVPPAVDTSGLLISAKIGGGVEGTEYALTMRFRTTGSEELDQTIVFLCASTTESTT